VISAYGSRAIRYQAAMGDIDAVIVEAQFLGEGYVEAVRRRTEGRSFYGMLLLDETRDRTMTQLVPAVLQQPGGPDRHREILYSVQGGNIQMNGKSVADVLAESDLQDPNARAAAKEFLTLCPAMLVRSHTEYERLSAFAVHRRPYEVIVLEPALPVVERRLHERPGFVLWTPERDADAAAFPVFGLSELHGEVTLVSADGVAPNGSGIAAYTAADPRVADALSTADVIVFADATDPGAAIAFARAGYGIVAPISSGVDEFVRDVCAYDPATLRQLHLAATMALTRPASLRALPSAPPRAPLRPSLPSSVAAAPPPATLVIPTFNRRADLNNCLQCLAAQTYPNVRAVVVNDAGEAVDDIVARYPFARLRNLEKNAGAVEAFIAGVELVAGGYVAILPDDDWLYPDHVQLLVTAMERTGASVGHANTLIRYVRRSGAGAFDTTGYNAGIFIETATPTEAMVATPIGGHSLMLRLSVFADVGGWRADCILADQEIQMRVAQRYTFAYVDQVTAEWRIHGENFSGKVDSIAEQRRVFEELHPVQSRPIVAAMRKAALERMAMRPPGFVFPPTLRLLAQ
jgi:Glycosyl transferase family 2